MGIAALILGIVGLVIAWIPFCGILALIPCLVGLGLGIADIIVKGKRGEPKGMGIAGTVLNAVALLIVILLKRPLSCPIPSSRKLFRRNSRDSSKRPRKKRIRTRTALSFRPKRSRFRFRLRPAGTEPVVSPWINGTAFSTGPFSASSATWPHCLFLHGQCGFCCRKSGAAAICG